MYVTCIGQPPLTYVKYNRKSFLRSCDRDLAHIQVYISSDNFSVACLLVNCLKYIYQSLQVRLLSQVRHQNLVSLEGFCYESQRQILVYEYLPGGSLADHLYGGFLQQHSVSIVLMWSYISSLSDVRVWMAM